MTIESTLFILYPEMRHTLQRCAPEAHVHLFDVAFRQHQRKNFTQTALVSPEATASWSAMTSEERRNTVSGFIANVGSLTRDSLRRRYDAARDAHNLGRGLYSYPDALLDALFVCLNPHPLAGVYTPAASNLMRLLIGTLPALSVASGAIWNPASVVDRRTILRCYKFSRANFFRDEVTRESMAAEARKKWTSA